VSAKVLVKKYIKTFSPPNTQSRMRAVENTIKVTTQRDLSRSPSLESLHSLTSLSDQTSIPPSSASSSSEYCIPTRIKMVNTSKLASVEQESPSWIPVLLTGDVTPEILYKYKNACIGYFETKDIKGPKQVWKILASFCDTRILDWISVNRADIIKWTFPNFMANLQLNYLHKDWEEITRQDLINISQAKDSFWNFYIKLQAKNSLLRDMTSYLSEEALWYKLESGMTEELAEQCRDAKVSKKETMADWLDTVRRLDDKLAEQYAKFDAKFEEFARQQQDAACKANNFTEPSCWTSNLCPPPANIGTSN
jgi:hypothetical protein